MLKRWAKRSERTQTNSRTSRLQFFKATRPRFTLGFLYSLHWLPITHVIDYQRSSVFFSVFHGTNPECLTELLMSTPLHVSFVQLLIPEERNNNNNNNINNNINMKLELSALNVPNPYTIPHVFLPSQSMEFLLCCLCKHCNINTEEKKKNISLLYSCAVEECCCQ